VELEVLRFWLVLNPGGVFLDLIDFGRKPLYVVCFSRDIEAAQCPVYFDFDPMLAANVGEPFASLSQDQGEIVLIVGQGILSVIP